MGLDFSLKFVLQAKRSKKDAISLK